jgi:hypothetical protein
MGKAFTRHTKRTEGKEAAIIAVLANRGIGIAEPNPTTIKSTAFFAIVIPCLFNYRHITRLTWRPSRDSGCMATRSNSRVLSKNIRYL